VICSSVTHHALTVSTHLIQKHCQACRQADFECCCANPAICCPTTWCSSSYLAVASLWLLDEDRVPYTEAGTSRALKDCLSYSRPKRTAAHHSTAAALGDSIKVAYAVACTHAACKSISNNPHTCIWLPLDVPSSALTQSKVETTPYKVSACVIWLETAR
jgi:hypothetical protein